MKYFRFLGAFLAGAMLFGSVGVTIAAITVPTTTRTINTFQPTYSFFGGATTTGTASIQQATSTNTTDGSGLLVIAGAKKVTVFFGHGGTATTSTATSTFSIQGTSDLTNWYDVKFMQSTSTTYQMTESVAGATSTIPFSLDVTNAYYAIRCIANGGGAVGTQGEHTCKASAEF